MADRICPQCGKATTEPICPDDDVRTVMRTLSAVDSVVTGSLIDGRYRVEKILGRGGFGAVYQATNNRTQQKVVVKVLKPDLTADPTQVQRFHNEARTMSLLSHPNTVRVYDFGQTESGLLFIAMELLGGTDLAAVLREAKTLEPLRTVRIAIAVLNSLAEAHEAGLVHRDLKPDNIFLSKVQGEDDYVRVIDFGIAKAADAKSDSGLTKTGFTVGTPKYMSPEQVLNKALDGRSDLYALGVILYQCLSGDVPFGGQSPMETLMMHLQQAPRPLREVAALPLPKGLNEVVMRALRKQPWERFTDAAEMRAALEEVRSAAETGGTPRPGSGLLVEIVETRRMPGKGRDADPPAPTTASAVPPAQAATAVLDSSELQALHATTDIDAAPLRLAAQAARITGLQPKPSDRPRTGNQRVPAPHIARSAEDSRPLPAMLDPHQGPPPRRAGLYVLAGLFLVIAAVGGIWWSQQPTEVPRRHRVAEPASPPAEAPPAAPRAEPPAAVAPTAQQPPELSAPLASAEVEQLQVAGLPRVKLCMQAFPGAVTTTAVAANVAVDAQGAVREVKLEADLRDQPIAACLVSALREQKLSASSDARRTGSLQFVVASAEAAKAVPAAPRPARRKAAGSPQAPRSNGDEAL